MFLETIAKQSKKIIELNKENKTLYEENKELRFENEEQRLFINRIEILIKNADAKKENYFTTFNKIKSELDSRQTYLVQ